MELHVTAFQCACGALYHGLDEKCPICTGAKCVTVKIDDSAQSESSLAHYQRWARSMWNWQDLNAELLPWDMRDDFLMATGLGGEAGEVLEVLKKVERKRKRNPDVQMDKEHLTEELGDVLYYLSIIASRHDITLDDVMGHNVLKLEDRKRNKS